MATTGNDDEMHVLHNNGTLEDNSGEKTNVIVDSTRTNNGMDHVMNEMDAGDQVFGDDCYVSRLKTKALLASTDTTNVLKRVVNTVESLRSDLRAREVTRKAEENEILEFERIFDKAKNVITVDMHVIETGLVDQCGNVTEAFNALEAKYTALIRSLKKEHSQAIEGTEFNDMHVLRESYDQLLENKRDRDEKESAMLERLNMSSLNDMMSSIMEQSAHNKAHDKLNKLVKVVLELTKCDTMTKVCEKMMQLEESIQTISLNRDQLMEENMKLKDQLVKADDVEPSRKENADYVSHKVETSQREHVMPVRPSELPDLPKFDGDKEGWKMFKEGFLLRYEQMGDQVAKCILKEKLTGDARIEYKGLPPEYKDKSIRECLKWLKNRCLGGRMYQRVEIDSKVRNQSVGNRSVDQVCEEMEQWIDKLYKGTEMQEDAKKRQILYLYRDHKEYAKLLELHDQNASYFDLKKHMQTAEWVANRTKSNRTGDSDHSYGSHNGKARKENMEISSGRANECMNCGKKGHTAEECWSKPVASYENQENSQRKDDEAYVGYVKVECYDLVDKLVNLQNASEAPQLMGVVNRKSRGMRENDLSSAEHNSYGGYVMAESEELVNELLVNIQNIKETPQPMGVVNRKSRGVREDILRHVELDDTNGTDRMETGIEDPTFIRRVQPVKGTIGGVQVEACLDTGSEVNLIDKRIIDQMKDVRIKRVTRSNIRDAQGQLMRIVGAVTLDVEMNVGRRCRVGFIISEVDINMILLGNSALHEMGMELRERKKLEPTDECLKMDDPDRCVLEDPRSADMKLVQYEKSYESIMEDGYEDYSGGVYYSAIAVKKISGDDVYYSIAKKTLHQKNIIGISNSKKTLYPKNTIDMSGKIIFYPKNTIDMSGKNIFYPKNTSGSKNTIGISDTKKSCYNCREDGDDIVDCPCSTTVSFHE